MKTLKRHYHPPTTGTTEMLTLTPLQASTEQLPFNPTDPGGTDDALAKKGAWDFCWDDETDNPDDDDDSDSDSRTHH